ncbi:MAG: hypothetical protein IJ055_04955 [Oscillospiraceae bacterium]|nr:hypothetical protein [Oscillospiraceae bacterium]
MKRQETYIRFPLTLSQILGILMLIAGLWLLFGSGLQAYRAVTRDPEEQLWQHEEELEAGVPQETVLEEIRLANRRQAMWRVPLVLFGGILTAAAPPLFYAPYAEGLIRLRHRRRKEEDEEVWFVDEAYDYPDDEFDYIIDPAVRARLIRERDARREQERKRRRR